MNILVTGASRGIGRAIAGRLAASGHRLLLVGRDLDTLDAASEGVASPTGPHPLTARVDLASEKDVSWLFDFAKEKSFKPDVLVLNAGIFIEGSLLSADMKALKDTLDVNLLSSFALVRGFANALKESDYAILLEQDDEWAVADRRYFSAESMKQLTTPSLSATAQEMLTAIA